MAGANNAQMKARGWKARDVTKARAKHDRLSDATMRAAGATPKRFSHAAKAVGASNRSTAAADTAKHAGREEARRVYQQGNAGARDKVGAMRADIRERTGAVRTAEREHRDTSGRVMTAARGQATKEAGGKKRLTAVASNRVERRAQEIHDRHPDVQRTARSLKTEREGLQSALKTRDAVARGRKAASTPGQGDLFGAAPARGPSPFQQRQAQDQKRAAYAVGLAERVRQARSEAPARQAAAAKAKAERDFRAKASSQLFHSRAQQKAKADAAAKAARQAGPAAQRMKQAKANLPALRAARDATRARRTSAIAARADNQRLTRAAGVATATDRAAAATLKRAQKNASVGVQTYNKGTMQMKAVAKVGDYAVVPEGRFNRYNLTHVPTGLSVSGFMSKNVALSMLGGLSGKAGKRVSDRITSGEYAKSGTTAAMSRYGRIMLKRQDAHDLHSAKQAHDRAVAGGNPTVIRGARTRLDDARKNYARHVK